MAFPIYPTPKIYNNIPSGYPICTVISFKSDGDFIPVSFGVVFNEERFRYNITAIKSIKDNGNVKSFECTYEDFGQSRTVLLKFYIKSCLWVVG